VEGVTEGEAGREARVAEWRAATFAGVCCEWAVGQAPCKFRGERIHNDILPATFTVLQLHKGHQSDTQITHDRVIRRLTFGRR
jgi:hypothetical protein